MRLDFVSRGNEMINLLIYCREEIELTYYAEINYEINYRGALKASSSI